MFAAIGSAFHIGVYQPLYNALIFIVGIVPWHDVGIAVILLTIIARILIYPLSKRVVESQMVMKKIAPEVEEIKKKYKKNSTEQSQAVFAFYKEKGVHPFASFGLLLIQMPVLIGLYLVFAQGGLPAVDPTLLYSFVGVPEGVNMHFLGLIDMGATHNWFLAGFVALTQLVYSRLSMGPRDKTPDATPVEASLSGDMAKSFDLQARYFFPVIFGVISYFVVSAAPLYWATSNLAMIAQEYGMGRRFNVPNGAEK